MSLRGPDCARILIRATKRPGGDPLGSYSIGQRITLRRPRPLDKVQHAPCSARESLIVSERAQRSGPPPSPAGRFFARTSPRPSQCPANLPEQAVDLARARSRVPYAADFLGERPSEILAEVFGRSTRGVENRYSRAACIFSYSPRCSRGMERRPLARRRAGPLSAFQHDVDAAVRDARVARSGFADPYLAERRTIEPVLR
jgi:hypothetical protein